MTELLFYMGQLLLAIKWYKGSAAWLAGGKSSIG